MEPSPSLQQKLDDLERMLVAERAARKEAEDACQEALKAAAAARMEAHEMAVDAFLNNMRDVSGFSSAYTSSPADVERRGATNPVPGAVDAVLVGLELPARGSAARAWANFAGQHKL